MERAKSMVSWGREGWAGGQKQTISELQTTEEYSQVGRCEMNKARDLKVIGEVSGGDKKTVTSAVPTFFYHLEKRIGPILRALATIHTKNVQAFVVWLTLIAQQRQTTSW